MTKRIEAERFSVYLGRGLYVGGVVFPDGVNPDAVVIHGAHDGAALQISYVDNAAKYGRAAAVRMCHVARRCGVGAWLVSSPALSV